MTPERFAAILAAYGADPSRWPPAERAAAERIAVADPTALTAEAALDAALDGYAVALPGAALIHRIAATAPPPRPAWRRLLWPGFGLAGATAACGALAGAMLQPMAAPQLHGGEGEALSYAWSGEEIGS